VFRETALFVFWRVRGRLFPIFRLATPTFFRLREEWLQASITTAFPCFSRFEKRLGLRFSTQDIYINVAGGLKADDTSCDAAASLALISSLKDVPIPENLMVIGEVGLSGELRSVFGIEQRINEAARLGFTQIALPFRAVGKVKLKYPGVEIISVRSVYDLLKLLGI
jgi:DNA repair protein RadA/Sms